VWIAITFIRNDMWMAVATMTDGHFQCTHSLNDINNVVVGLHLLALFLSTLTPT
jgi:hypothetical protein